MTDEDISDEVLHGAFEELVRDDLRSFSLVVTLDDGSVVRTHANTVEGDPEAGRAADSQLMMAFSLVDEARILGMDPIDYVAHCLVFAQKKRLTPRDFEPVDEPASLGENAPTGLDDFF